MVLLTLLGKVGLVSAEGLAKKRKYAIVLAFVVAAFLTPPDIISQTLLAVPVYLLYELGIIMAKVFAIREQPEPGTEPNK